MKEVGVIKLTVEVDYDAMLSGDKLNALIGFTGETDKKNIIASHMQMIGDKLSTIVKDKPFMAFQIDGRLVPVESDDVAKNQDLPPLDKIEEEPQQEEDSTDLVKLLDDAIQHISLNKGMPTKITINGTMSDALKNGNNLIRVVNDVIDVYNGFPVFVEGMEEPFIIEYKDYKNGEVGQYYQHIENRTEEEVTA